jgi:hypothetical protein
MRPSRPSSTGSFPGEWKKEADRTLEVRPRIPGSNPPLAVSPFRPRLPAVGEHEFLSPARLHLCRGLRAAGCAPGRGRSRRARGGGAAAGGLPALFRETGAREALAEEPAVSDEGAFVFAVDESESFARELARASGWPWVRSSRSASFRSRQALLDAQGEQRGLFLSVQLDAQKGRELQGKLIVSEPLGGGVGYRLSFATEDGQWRVREWERSWVACR